MTYPLPVESAIIDLSKATKLRDVLFRPQSSRAKWITAAFQTITPNHRELQKISLGFPYFADSLNVDTLKQSTNYGEWLDLDRLLVQFWESRSTGPKVICVVWEGQKRDFRGFTECLFPELTKRGAIDLVE